MAQKMLRQALLRGHPAQPVLRLFCLLEKQVKIPHDAQLKIRFFPLSADKIPRPLQLPVVALHLCFHWLCEDRAQIPLLLHLHPAELLM